MNLDLHIYLGDFSGKFGDVIITGDDPTVIWVTVEEQFAKKRKATVLTTFSRTCNIKEDKNKLD